MSQADHKRGSAYRSRLARTVSEVAGPAPLILASILEVGLSSAAVLPTVVAAVAMAIIPSLIMVWMVHTGAVSDRFVSDRRQRVPYLVISSFFFGGGVAAVALLGAPRALTVLVVILLIALLFVIAINFFWKISIHATLAAFFSGLQVYFLGPVAVVFFLVLGLVTWARRVLNAHTGAQILAGAALGVAMLLAFAWLI